MADLDDLLGGEPSSPAVAAKSTTKDPLDDMDDLLGGGGGGGGGTGGETNFLDDDLLFGGGGSSSIAAVGSADSAQTTEVQAIPLTIPKVTDVPAALAPFNAGDCFFIKFIQEVHKDNTRARRVLSVYEKVIHIDDPEGPGKRIRELSVERLFGIIMQRRPAKGSSKETDIHYLLQIDGDSDYWFALATDPMNASKSAQLPIETVLTAIIASWGLSLPVAALKDSGEDLAELARWQPTPDVRVRHALSETLTYRTEVSGEVEALRKENSRLELTLLQLKTSSEGQTAANLNKDIETMQETIAAFRDKLSKLARRKSDEVAAREQLQADVAAEEKRRDDAIKERLRGEEQEQLLRRAKEFELMKAAHRRELGKLSFLTGLYEEHARNRTSDSYSGVQVTLRIEELEEELRALQGHLARQQDQYQSVMGCIKEVKSRLSLARDTQERLDADLKLLKESEPSAALPDSINNVELPDITPVTLNFEGTANNSNSKPSGPTTSPKPSPARESPPPATKPKEEVASPEPVKRPPIVLDDDDDI